MTVRNPLYSDIKVSTRQHLQYKRKKKNHLTYVLSVSRVTKGKKKKWGHMVTAF